MNICFTDTANLAITEQWDYYDQQQGPDLANRWEAAVAAAVNSLCQSPDRGGRCRLTSDALASLRWIYVKGFPFRLFYLTEKTSGKLIIVHVIHNKRDIQDLLEEAVRS